MKKFLALALAALMLAVMLPVTALADNTPIAVLDFTTMDTTENTADHWKWDKDTKTLTLSGSDITAQIILPDGATIVLQAGTTNTIRTYATAGGMGLVGYGLSVEKSAEESAKDYGSAKIRGTGSLEVIDIGSFDWNPLIYGSFTFGDKGAGGPRVKMIRTTQKNGTVTGEIVVNSGNVTVMGEADSCSAFLSENIVVNGGSLELSGSFGAAWATVTVTGGTAKLKSALAQGETAGAGLYVGSINVTGGTLWLVGNNVDYGAALLTAAPNAEAMTVLGSTAYDDPTPSQDVTWAGDGGVRACIGDIPARTLKITAAGAPGGGEDPINPPPEEEPTVPGTITIIVPSNEETPKPAEDQKNPATGAHDFVGVAAAAAVMALLGSAVVLRKK